MEVFSKLRDVFPQIKELEHGDRYEETQRMEELFEDFTSKEDVLFDSFIIENDKFQKFRSVRKQIFLIVFFVALPMFALLIMDNSREMLFNDFMNPHSPFRPYYIGKRQ